ncbi:MAG: hypothetical protein RI918_1119 [Pseudomonadota bacterium]|jgi:hypothetical protein
MAMTANTLKNALLVLLVAMAAIDGYLFMRFGNNMEVQLFTPISLLLWAAVFANVMEHIQVSHMSPEEYTEYKNRPQPASLM